MRLRRAGPQSAARRLAIGSVVASMSGPLAVLGISTGVYLNLHPGPVLLQTFLALGIVAALTGVILGTVGRRRSQPRTLERRLATGGVALGITVFVVGLLLVMAILALQGIVGEPQDG